MDWSVPFEPVYGSDLHVSEERTHYAVHLDRSYNNCSKLWGARASSLLATLHMLLQPVQMKKLWHLVLEVAGDVDLLASRRSIVKLWAPVAKLVVHIRVAGFPLKSMSTVCLLPCR